MALSTHTHTYSHPSCTLALENANRVNIPILSYTPADTYNFGWDGMPYVSKASSGDTIFLGLFNDYAVSER